MHPTILRSIAMIGMILLLVWVPAGADAPNDAPQGPTAARQALAGDGQLQISDQDRCPLCGMFPAKRPQSAAGMMLADGRTFYFCGNGCLLRAWRSAPKYLGVAQDKIQRMVVRDYFSGAPSDARSVWWVAGSDVIGPMGRALVALQSSREVEQFKSRHGGRTVFQLDRMDDELWNTLFPAK